MNDKLDQIAVCQFFQVLSESTYGQFDDHNARLEQCYRLAVTIETEACKVVDFDNMDVWWRYWAKDYGTEFAHLLHCESETEWPEGIVRVFGHLGLTLRNSRGHTLDGADIGTLPDLDPEPVTP